MKYTVENLSRVYDDENGNYYQIAPDADGVGCVEIIYFDLNKDRKFVDTGHRISFPPEMALLIAEEIKKQAEYLIQKEKE